MRSKILFSIFLFMSFSALSVEFDLNLERGWNLISVPIEGSSADDFTGIVPGIMLYDPDLDGGSYEAIDTLYPGTGYWVLSPSEQTVTLSGDIDTCIDYPELYYGWNMGGAAETKGEIIGLV